MKYINPFSILGLTPSDNIDRQSLRKLKREWLTEFELQGSVTINLNGQEMDKTAVLKVFDQFDNERLLTHHLTIFKHSSLQAFLENNSLRFFRSNQTADFFDQHDEEFIQYLQPYFSHQFDFFFSKAIKEKSRPTIKLLSKEAVFLPYQYEGACFKNSYRFLMAEVNELSDMTSINRKKIKKIKHYFTDQQIIFFNTLPDYFFDVRIKLGEYLEDIALLVNNELNDTMLARHILAQGLQYKTNESTRYRLQYVLDQLNFYPEEEWGNGSPTATPRSIKSTSNWWWLVFAVSVFYILRALFH